MVCGGLFLSASNAKSCNFCECCGVQNNILNKYRLILQENWESGVGVVCKCGSDHGQETTKYFLTTSVLMHL